MHKTKHFALILGVLAMSLAISYLILAWQEPSQVPPGGNVPTPINVGTEPQAKAGRFSATEFYDYNDPSYYLNPSGDSNLGGNLSVGGNVDLNSFSAGSGFQVDSMGIPSWGGKRFQGYTTVEVQTGTSSVCKTAVEGLNCQQICESYGETCIQKWYQCSGSLCESRTCYGPNPCTGAALEGDRCECEEVIYGEIAVPIFE